MRHLRKNTGDEWVERGRLPATMSFSNAYKEATRRPSSPSLGATTMLSFWVARSFVPSDAIAEEVVQDTWMAVVRGVSKFEGRSSIKTWLVRIAINRARSTGARESRAASL